MLKVLQIAICGLALGLSALDSEASPLACSSAPTLATLQRVIDENLVDPINQNALVNGQSVAVSAQVVEGKIRAEEKDISNRTRRIHNLEDSELESCSDDQIVKNGADITECKARIQERYRKEESLELGQAKLTLEQDRKELESMNPAPYDPPVSITADDIVTTGKTEWKASCKASFTLHQGNKSPAPIGEYKYIVEQTDSGQIMVTVYDLPRQ